MGAYLTAAASVTVYKKYLQPYYGTVQLGTPAVTNGGGSAGLTYLDDFLTLCTGCAYNFVNVHFFVDRSEMNVAQYIEALKAYVDINVPAVIAKREQTAGLPIAIGEVSFLFAYYPLSSLTFLTNIHQVLARGRF